MRDEIGPRLPPIGGPAPLRWAWWLLAPLIDRIIGLHLIRRLQRRCNELPREGTELDRLNRVTGLRGV
ncbi:MAG: hypothetical protein ACKPEA_01665, partial [Planctomycetota bacterium]